MVVLSHQKFKSQVLLEMIYKVRIPIAEETFKITVNIKLQAKKWSKITRLLLKPKC